MLESMLMYIASSIYFNVTDESAHKYDFTYRRMKGHNIEKKFNMIYKYLHRVKISTKCETPMKSSNNESMAGWSSFASCYDIM